MHDLSFRQTSHVMHSGVEDATVTLERLQATAYHAMLFKDAYIKTFLAKHHAASESAETAAYYYDIILFHKRVFVFLLRYTMFPNYLYHTYGFLFPIR